MSTAIMRADPEGRLDRLPASAFRRRWTHAQACAELPETLLPIEIWDGELTMSPTPFFLHQHVIARFYRALDAWVRRRKAGVTVLSPMDVVLAEDLVLQPDIMFIAKERTRIIQRHVMGAPDLAVEVVSPGRRKRDYKDKRDRYDAHGVKEYWIVDPGQQQIEVWFRKAAAADRLVLQGRYTGRQFASSQLLPGFKVRVDQTLSASLDD
jgi:Uma2 family endonuclease